MKETIPIHAEPPKKTKKTQSEPAKKTKEQSEPAKKAIQPQMPESIKTVTICKGITKSGTPCSRKTINTYCHSHKDQATTDSTSHQLDIPTSAVNLEHKGTEQCSACGEQRPASDYYEKRGKFRSQCRPCRNVLRAKYKRDARERDRQDKITNGELKVAMDLNNIVCRKCTEEKPKSAFRQNRRVCHECEKTDGRQYRQSDVGKQHTAEWIAKNPGRMTELQADWYQQKKPVINAKNVARYHVDAGYRLKYSCRKRILRALNSPTLRVSDNVLPYLNSSIPFLTEWLMRCFSQEMTINNHGTRWHMDHVIPIHRFNLQDPEEIRLCFSWFNISPLKGTDNLRKHAKIDITQVKTHLQKLTDFSKEKQVEIPQEYFDLCARHLTTTGTPKESKLPLTLGNQDEELGQ